MHFQLTRNCNLRCRMCGQWGVHGYQHEHLGEPELTCDDWFRIIDELPPALHITLWGGEPFVHPDCLAVARRLQRRGLRTSIVTNGVLLGKYAPEMSGLFAEVFVSIDGPAPVHDGIRGMAGTFERVDAGIRALRARLPGQRLCIKTTLVRENLGSLAELAPQIRAWKVDRWSLDPQMFLSAARGQGYAAFQRSLGVDRVAALSWQDEFDPGYGVRVAAAVASLLDANPDLVIAIGGGGMTPKDLVDWYDKPDADATEQHCLAPFRRLSIQSDGNTSFCLDIADGTLGNVKEQSVDQIFHSPAAVRFRAAILAGENPACLRCAWKCQPPEQWDRHHAGSGTAPLQGAT
jgi:MoaA/NifB/PqqE/SkfB family radical SAM enzyme